MYRQTPGMSVRSAGIAPRARRRVSAEDVVWADRIVVFEDQHREHILRHHPQPGLDERIVDLGIPDAYNATDRGLEAELRELLTELIGPPGVSRR